MLNPWSLSSVWTFIRFFCTAQLLVEVMAINVYQDLVRYEDFDLFQCAPFPTNQRMVILRTAVHVRLLSRDLLERVVQGASKTLSEFLARAVGCVLKHAVARGSNLKKGRLFEDD